MKNIILLLLISTSMFCQERGKKSQEVKAMKIAHITAELSLTPEQAAKFWPIYNSFELKERKIRRERIALTGLKKKQKRETMSEKEASDVLRKIEQLDDELHAERRKFNSALREVLPASKIILLNQAEEDFGRRLLRQYRAKGPNRN